MISKGKFHYLRDKYRGIVRMNRFIANIAWQWEADSINGRTYTPEAIQKAVKDFERNIGAKWEQVKNSWVADDCFHVVIEKPKGPAYLNVQRGKHRQAPEEGSPRYKVWLFDDLQGQSRPLTPAELENQEKFADYMKALGELKLEDVLVDKPRMRLTTLGKFTKEDCEQMERHAQFIANLWGWTDGKQNQPAAATVPHVSVVDTRSR